MRIADMKGGQCTYKLIICQEGYCQDCQIYIDHGQEGGKIQVVENKTKEPITGVVEDAIKCPLGLVCYPSCSWWKDSKCTFSEEVG